MLSGLYSGRYHLPPSYPHLPPLVPAHAQQHTPWLYYNHPIGTGPHTLAGLDNEGKVLTGKDRQGDEWQITVHGPGRITVNDATDGDASFNDDIDTITIRGSDPEKTFVTGQVTASYRMITDGTVRFNRLVADNGVNHIVLNGFNLAPTVEAPDGVPRNFGPEIYLPGGVKYLSFNDVEAPIDLAGEDQAIEIVVGQPNSPLSVAPSIRIGSVYNTVFDSSIGGAQPGTVPVVPSVSIQVNGYLNELEMISATGFPIESPGQAVNFPKVGATGRTGVRALGIGGLKVVGSAENFTASRTAIPFQTAFSGLDGLGHAAFGGTADGVGLDVAQGNIGRLSFLGGLGDPTGALTGGTNLGRPVEQWGNAAFGLLGGQVVAANIGHIDAGPAYMNLQTHPNPNLVQEHRTGQSTLYTRPGRAMTNALIMAGGSIYDTTIVGDLQSTEIKAGADYTSYAAGLQAERTPSQINPVQIRGNLVDSVVSATYRPYNYTYGDRDPTTGLPLDQGGPGRMQGHLGRGGGLYRAGLPTSLYNQGSGFYARSKAGYLPPPQLPTRLPGDYRGL